MSDRNATFLTYTASLGIAVAGWGVYEWTLVFGAVMSLVTFFYNRHHKLKMEKQDLEFKLETLRILREKPVVSLDVDTKVEEYKWQQDHVGYRCMSKATLGKL